jgi:hypothetical protein
MYVVGRSGGLAARLTELDGGHLFDYVAIALVQKGSLVGRLGRDLLLHALSQSFVAQTCLRFRFQLVRLEPLTCRLRHS